MVSRKNSKHTRRPPKVSGRLSLGLLAKISTVLALAAYGPACLGFGVNDLSGERLIGGDAYDYRAPVGSSAHALLKDDTFKELVVEIQATDSSYPTTETLNRFQLFLQRYLKKPRGIRLQINPTMRSTGKTALTLQDIRDIEDRTRQMFTQKDRVTMYVFFADGAAGDDTSTLRTLGQAYRNSSIVIYEKTLQAFSGSADQPQRFVLETNVLTHEVGHVLGLVNLGTRDRSGHEDKTSPMHCNEPTCLMHSSAEQANVGLKDNQTAIRDFDGACLKDLANP